MLFALLPLRRLATVPLRTGPLVLLSVLVLAGPARAEFVANFTGASPAVVLNVRLGSTTYSNVLVGQYNWQVASGDPQGLTTPGGTFQTFCIELNDSFLSPVTYSVDALQNGPQPGPPNPMGDARANLIRELWGRFYNTIGSDSTRAAAFQVSIWEIVHDNLAFNSGGFYKGRVNNGSGSFYVTSSNSAVISQANSWLGQLNNDASFRENRLVALISPDEQDQVALLPTPAPPGLLTALLGVAGAAGYWWRCRRQPA